MKTLGQVLGSYREKKRLTVAGVAKRTAVPETIITALEADEYASLPASPLVRGYILLLAAEVGIAEETALALYRRDVETRHTPEQHTPTRLKRPWSFRQNLFTPRFLSVAVLSLGILIGAMYTAWQWFSLSQPPELEVTAPTGQTLLTSPVIVTGRTATDNTVTINTEVVSLDINGNFQYELPLPPGERAIVISAEDSRGRTAEHVLFVTVE